MNFRDAVCMRYEEFPKKKLILEKKKKTKHKARLKALLQNRGKETVRKEPRYRDLYLSMKRSNLLKNNEVYHQKNLCDILGLKALLFGLNVTG